MIVQLNRFAYKLSIYMLPTDRYVCHWMILADIDAIIPAAYDVEIIASYLIAIANE